MKSNFDNSINGQAYVESTNSYELGGGKKEKWKSKLEIESQSLNKQTFFPEGMNLRDLDVILNNIKRTEVPYFLNPETATFIDVAIHAHVRQELGVSTIKKHLRYALMMETHVCPINFRDLKPEDFIRHMDYRIEYERATANVLKHEKKALLMFLRAFRQYTEDWDKYVKIHRIPASESHRDVVVPLPAIINKLYHAEYSTDSYENVLFQSVVFFGFNYGPRPPSEICNLDTDDLVIYGDGTGYIILTEEKKHGKTRRVYPWNKMVLSSKVYQTPKNYLKTWRPKVYDENISGNALFLQPSGKRVTGHYLRTHIAPVFKDITQDSRTILYDMRHTYGTYLYARTKDIKKVAYSLGHTKTQNVDHYIYLSEEIENQAKTTRRDLFHQALRQSQNSD